MASFFKPSCIFFWLIWIVCMSYSIGSEVYSNRYMPMTDKDSDVMYVMRVLCIFNAAFCFVGCVFIKCDITHLFCALMFILPVTFVNGILGYIGIRLVKERQTTGPPLIDQYYELFEAPHEPPYWLLNTQKNTKCCGILSYLDYPLFRPGDGHHHNVTPQQGETQLTWIVHRTCCSATQEVMAKGKKKVHDPNADKCNSDLDKKEGNVTMVKDLYAKLFSPDHCPSPKGYDLKNKGKKKYGPKENDTFNPIDMIFEYTRCGCYYNLTQSYDDIYQYHYIFFIIMMFATGLSLFIYIKMVCRRRDKDNVSDHSLDVDRLSMIDIDVPTTAGIDSDTKDWKVRNLQKKLKRAQAKKVPRTSVFSQILHKTPSNVSTTTKQSKSQPPPSGSGVKGSGGSKGK